MSNQNKTFGRRGLNSSNSKFASPSTSTKNIEDPAVPVEFHWMDLLFSFDGRIGRLEFWGIRVAFSMFGVAVYFICKAALTPGIALVPTVAVAVVWAWGHLASGAKRWHDRNKSAWWGLIGLIPILGPVWEFVECGCMAGSPGSNAFGPSSDDH